MVNRYLDGEAPHRATILLDLVALDGGQCGTAIRQLRVARRVSNLPPNHGCASPAVSGPACAKCSAPTTARRPTAPLTYGMVRLDVRDEFASSSRRQSFFARTSCKQLVETEVRDKLLELAALPQATSGAATRQHQAYRKYLSIEHIYDGHRDKDIYYY